MDRNTYSIDEIDAEIVDEVSTHAKNSSQRRDVLELAKIGKKQILKRRFGFLSMFGFCCTITGTWEGVLSQFVFGLENGGPAGLVYGYIVTWVGTLSVFLVMAELSSMLPTAGGQYHWVSVLAPRPIKRLLSYVTGWATVVSWIAAATTSAFLTAAMTQALVNLSIPSYQPEGWQATLMMWAALLIAVLFTTALGSVLPFFEIMFLLLHVLGFFATFIPLAYHVGSIPEGGKKAHTIFTTFFNLGGWSSQTLSFFVGLQGNAAALLGLDGAIHMAEEVEKSSVNVARSMTISILVNGSLGFAMLILVLFSVSDLESLTQSTSTFPFMNILADGFGSTNGASVIVALIIFLGIASTLATMSSAGRMLWSFARDRGVPGWQWLIRVDRRTSIPFNTIFVTATIGALLGLINIGSSTVFNDVISLVLAGFYMSYLFAALMLLHRRIRGEIGESTEIPRDDASSDEGNGQTDNASHLPNWGPWRVPGLLGTLNNIFAVVYLLILWFFAFWPATVHVNAQNMDYACVVLGAVMIGSLIWYYARAKKYYSGPVFEVRIAATPLRHSEKYSVSYGPVRPQSVGT